MRRAKNRICGFLLAFVLCLVLVVTPAFADGDEKVVTFPASDDEQTERTKSDRLTGDATTEIIEAGMTDSIFSADSKISYHLAKGGNVIFPVAVIGTDDLLLYMFENQTEEGSFRYWWNGSFFADHKVSIDSVENEKLKTAAWTKRCAIFLSFFPELVSPPNMDEDETPFLWKVDMHGSSTDYLFADFATTLNHLISGSSDEEYTKLLKMNGVKLVVDVVLADNADNTVQKASVVLAKSGENCLHNVGNGVLFYNLLPNTTYHVKYHIYAEYTAGGKACYQMLYPQGNDLSTTWSSYQKIQTTKLDSEDGDGTKSKVEFHTYRFSWNSKLKTPEFTNTDKLSSKMLEQLSEYYDMQGTKDPKQAGFSLSLRLYKRITSSVSKREVKNGGGSGLNFDITNEDPMTIIRTGTLTYQPDGAVTGASDTKMLASWFKLIRLFAITLCVFGMMGAIVRIATPNVSGFAVFRLREALSGWVMLLFVIGAATTILSMLVQILFF